MMPRRQKVDSSDRSNRSSAPRRQASRPTSPLLVTFRPRVHSSGETVGTTVHDGCPTLVSGSPLLVVPMLETRRRQRLLGGGDYCKTDHSNIRDDSYYQVAGTTMVAGSVDGT
eukprot:8468984-Pyramimonas_sp.AAC.2